MRIIFAVLAFLYLGDAAFAQSCGTGGKVSFAAQTENGFPFPASAPEGLITKLKSEQCGFTAVWVPSELAKSTSCKFGQVFDVVGTETKPVPPGGPFGGNMLVVTSMTCRN